MRNSNFSETSFQRLKGSKCLQVDKIYRERDRFVHFGNRLPIEDRGDLKLSTVGPYLLGTAPSKSGLPRQLLRACLKISNVKQNLSKLACVWDSNHCILETTLVKFVWRHAAYPGSKHEEAV